MCDCIDSYNCRWCGKHNCDACSKESCDWCENTCPHCSTTVYICDKTICAACIYAAVEESDLLFCETCKTFKRVYGLKDCKAHKTVKDKLVVTNKLKEMFSEIEFIFS